MAKLRSPRFPSIGLTEATALAKRLWDAEKRTPVSQDDVGRAWGYKGTSGLVKRKIAAMGQFGLLEKENGSLRLSDRGIAIVVHPAGSTERNAAIREAVLAPALFLQMYESHLDASDGAMTAYLITKQGFTDRAASDFIEAFKDTCNLAKLSEKTYTAGAGEDDKKTTTIGVGDYIPWESQGVCQFESPKQVVETSDDGAFLFVKGTSIGIPVDQAQKADPPVELKPPVKSPLVTSREVSNLEEGEAILQWPASLSPDSVHELEDWLSLVVKKLKRRYTSES